MISPGLLTASTNKADHLGTSGAGFEWCCIGSVLLSLRVVLVWGLKQCFPLVGTLGHEWVPERTPVGAKRSGALGAERRVVRAGSRGTIGPSRGKLRWTARLEW